MSKIPISCLLLRKKGLVYMIFIVHIIKQKKLMAVTIIDCKLIELN